MLKCRQLFARKLLSYSSGPPVSTSVPGVVVDEIVIAVSTVSLLVVVILITFILVIIRMRSYDEATTNTTVSSHKITMMRQLYEVMK